MAYFRIPATRPQLAKPVARKVTTPMGYGDVSYSRQVLAKALLLLSDGIKKLNTFPYKEVREVIVKSLQEPPKRRRVKRRYRSHPVVK